MDTLGSNKQHCATPTEVCQQLLKLLSGYKAHMMRLAEEYNLTMMQLHALHSIANGNRTMGKLAHVMHCDASNVTGIIDRLVAMSFVTRQEDPEDRRVKTLLLTARGEAILQRVMDELPVRLGCARLSDDELQTLHATIQKLDT